MYSDGDMSKRRHPWGGAIPANPPDRLRSAARHGATWSKGARQPGAIAVTFNPHVLENRQRLASISPSQTLSMAQKTG